MGIQPDTFQAILENGEIELKGQFTRGANYTFLVNVAYEGSEILAVYKPERGEQPLWDFPENTLARREVCAYLVSQALGFGMVPFTLLRDGPLGPGSLQQYIDHDPNYHYFTFKPAELERLRPVVLFDLLVNNADRKGSHILVQKRTRKLYLIDHGLCFHVEDKLRTVIWDFAGRAHPGGFACSSGLLPGGFCRTRRPACGVCFLSQPGGTGCPELARRGPPGGRPVPVPARRPACLSISADITYSGVLVPRDTGEQENA